MQRHSTNLAIILYYRLFVAWNHVQCKQQSSRFWNEFNRGRYPRMLCWKRFIISLDKRRWCRPIHSWTNGQHIATWIFHIRMQCIHGLRSWLELSILEKYQWFCKRYYWPKLYFLTFCIVVFVFVAFISEMALLQLAFEAFGIINMTSQQIFYHYRASHSCRIKTGRSFKEQKSFKVTTFPQHKVIPNDRNKYSMTYSYLTQP